MRATLKAAMVMGVLSIFLTFMYQPTTRSRLKLESEQSAAIAQIKNFQMAAEQYREQTGKHPGSLASIREFLYKHEVPLDPWGNAYGYVPHESGYTIVSFGADGEKGGEDYDADINTTNLDRF